MKRGYEQTENTNVLKAIEAYDIYPKISERCRQEIVNLKAHRKDLVFKAKNNG